MRILWFFLGILTGALGSYFMTRTMLSLRVRFVTLSAVVASCLIAGVVQHEYTHATPERAQAAVNPSVGPFEKIPFAKGVVLLTPSGQGGSFTAWYLEKNLWGWHVVLTSEAAYNLAPQNYNVDFESFTEHGQTFVWGTEMTPIKQIVEHHDGRTFTCDIGKYPAWHMILPFQQNLVINSEWTMVRPDGQVAPLFK